MTERVFAIIFTVVVTLATGVVAQSQTKEETDGGCAVDSIQKVDVTLISVEKRYVLVRGVPINVTIRAQNCTADPIKLRAEPFFSFLREGVSDSGAVSGDKYYGRVNDKWPRTIEPIMLMPKSIQKFCIDVTSLELMGAMSSISIWSSPFFIMEKGEYRMRGAVSSTERDSDGKGIFFWSSNEIVIVKEDARPDSAR